MIFILYCCQQICLGCILGFFTLPSFLDIFPDMEEDKRAIRKACLITSLLTGIAFFILHKILFDSWV